MRKMDCHPFLQDFAGVPEKVLEINGKQVFLRPATEETIWDVEEILRRLADAGDGFAVDEFTKDGLFNRR